MADLRRLVDELDLYKSAATPVPKGCTARIRIHSQQRAVPTRSGHHLHGVAVAPVHAAAGRLGEPRDVRGEERHAEPEREQR